MPVQYLDRLPAQAQGQKSQSGANGAVKEFHAWASRTSRSSERHAAYRNAWVIPFFGEYTAKRREWRVGQAVLRWARDPQGQEGIFQRYQAILDLNAGRATIRYEQ